MSSQIWKYNRDIKIGVIPMLSRGTSASLKDGLHPNEKGQNMMARMIISAINSHYVSYTDGFNI